MSFTDKIIGPDEKLVGLSMIHWIYAAQGLLWLAGFMLVGSWLDSMAVHLSLDFAGNPGTVATNIIGNTIFLVCIILGIFLFMFYFVMMLTTEVALTTKRIIYKRGWIFVNVQEVDLEEIKAANVDNGYLGRILNYGYIKFDARFIENLNIPAIADPYRFLKALNDMRSQLRQDSMTVVLEGYGEPRVINEEESESKPKEKNAASRMSDAKYEALSNQPRKEIRDMNREMLDDVEEQREAFVEQVGGPEAPMAEDGQKHIAAQQKEKAHLVDFREKTSKDALKEKVHDSFEASSHDRKHEPKKA